MHPPRTRCKYEALGLVAGQAAPIRAKRPASEPAAPPCSQDKRARQEPAPSLRGLLQVRCWLLAAGLWLKPGSKPGKGQGLIQ
jgi:hypothetical protein